MKAWGIAEWYGRDVATMSERERLASADQAIASKLAGLAAAPQPVCPFMDTIKPGALCNKVGGVCSIRKYEAADDAVSVTDDQPTTLCPSRFLEHRGESSIFSYIAQEFFGTSSGAKVLKEIPFLEKESIDGLERGAKAGRIDWIVVPNPKPDVAQEMAPLDWIAVETQGVYFSGDSMWPDIEAYSKDPSKLHYPAGKRRPDYRSSGAKRLSPQLDAKSPVMMRWGRKVVVVVDLAFFGELGSLREARDFENSEVIWLVMRYDEHMELVTDRVRFSLLRDSIAALQATNAVDRSLFETMLKNELASTRSKKVFEA